MTTGRARLLPLLVAFGIVLGGHPLAAAASAPTADGSLRYDVYAYPDADRRGNAFENFFEAALRVRGRATDTLAYRAELRAVGDDAHYTAGIGDPRMEERRRPWVDVPEAVLDWTPRPELRVSIGRQIINWSGIDELQPANLMAPLDESEIFRRIPLGSFAVATHAELPHANVDLVVVPAAFQGARLPQGRWRFVPEGVGLHQDVPPVAFDETQAGLRLATRLDALELAVLGYVGRDMLPFFTLALPTTADGAPRATAHYARTRVGGATASYPLGEAWLLRSELVYFASPDPRRDEFFQYVPLGVEYTRGDLRFVVNYLRFDRTSRGTGAVSQGERRFYPSFLFGEASWDDGGRLRVRFRAGYDVQEDFAVVEPEVSYRVWRELRVTLGGAAIFAAHHASFDYFDQIRHEDRLALRLQYFL